jgi:LCP family protein required for cell wall assembly
MINPAPIAPKSSPYSASSAAGLPRTLQPITEDPKKKRFKRLLWITPLIVVAALLGYVGVKYHHLSTTTIVAHQGENSAILTYDPANKHQQLDLSAFKNPGDGRVNIVIVGVGGEGHGGAYLTDSIKLLSLDTINKSAVISSLPRDFYYGNGKINAVYSDAESIKAGNGGIALRKAVGDVFGVQVSHFMLMDFSGFKDLVDSLGGITINAPEAVYDTSYPVDSTYGYETFSVKAGVQTMNGTTALKYSRTRHADNDYKRQERQNLVIKAIEDKALTAGVLANPIKINSIINVLGDHIRTDLQPADIKSVIDIVRQIPGTSIGSSVLDTNPDLNLLTSSSDTSAGFISYPILGIKNYSAIHSWFQKNNPDPLLAKESPSVTLYGTGVATPKQLSAFADDLHNYGFTVTVSPTPATTPHGSTAFMRKSAAKKVSSQYLSSFLGTAATNGSPSGDADFEVVYVPSRLSAAR